MLRLPTIRRLLLVSLLAVCGTLAAYVVGYYALVVPGHVPDDFLPYAAHLRRTSTEPVTMTVERTHRYRAIGGAGEDLFKPMHDVDRVLRPGVWTETYVFAPVREP